MPLSSTYSPVAVIDIGSNSVRLVVYDGLKRHVRPVFNEKTLCGLGSDLSTTGRLPPVGKSHAAECFGRYVRLARALPAEELRVIATAAIRDAEDGPAFIAELESRHQINIETIPGDEEARLAALGVLATIHDPSGLAADLGGGSLELVEIGEQGPGERVSLPLGVLRLWRESGGDVEAMRARLAKAFGALPLLSRHRRHAEFYAIGGSFRMLARVHMRLAGYPLKLLHQYRLSPRELKRLCDDLLRLSIPALASLKGMQAERAHMVVPSLLVLEQIVKRTGCEHIVFCTGGIREGLLFDRLPPELRAQDPLLAYAQDILPDHRRGPYADALKRWLQPLLGHAYASVPPRLIEAFSVLSEAAIGMHPECRAEWACDMILYSSCTGLTHPERVWLALAMYHRYRVKSKIDQPWLALLPEHERESARLIGIGAALAYALSGGAVSLLEECTLGESGGRITLQVSGDDPVTDPATLEKLLEGLSESGARVAAASRAR